MLKNSIAITVLLVLGGVAFFVFREQSPAQRKQKQQAIEAVSAEKLDSIRVVRHEGTGDTLREEEIVLQLQDGVWRMNSPVDYPVTASSVEQMATALTELRVVDLISENKEKHHVLQVDDELGVEVEALGGGGKLAHLIVGVSRDNMTYVRLPGEDAVYRVHGMLRNKFNKSSKILRDKKIGLFDKGSVTRMRFINEYGELALERTGEGDDAVFAPVGVEIDNFDARKANGIAAGLAGLTTRDFADEVTGDEITGLGDGVAKVVFSAVLDGAKGEFTYFIGKELEQQRQTYFKTSLADQVFLPSTHMVKRFRAQASDFARTDEQVAKEEEQRKDAAAHAGQHEARAAGHGGGGPHALGGQPGGGQISPEMMEKIRRQMAAQAAQKK